MEMVEKLQVIKAFINHNLMYMTGEELDNYNFLIKTIEQQQKEIEQLKEENKTLLTVYVNRADVLTRYEQALKEIFIDCDDTEKVHDIAQKALEE